MAQAPRLVMGYTILLESHASYLGLLRLEFGNLPRISHCCLISEQFVSYKLAACLC